MKTLSALLLATFLVALPSACKSNEPDVPCVCGTQLGDLEGCAHASCRAGKPNPANPNCVCGQLEIPGEKKN